MSDQFKKEAAKRAAEDVSSGMRLGIGTGSTAEFFIHALAEKVRAGLDVIGVPTSERTRELSESLGISLTTLEETPQLDLTIDGADEFDPQLSLIKGGGGALLREKIVAAASEKMIVIVDKSKQVAALGQFPLPIEVNAFGLKSTTVAIEKMLEDLGLPNDTLLRKRDGQIFVTDGGHYIIDVKLGCIDQPGLLAEKLVAIPGVVEHGLFLDLATKAYVAGEDGVNTILPM